MRAGMVLETLTQRFEVYVLLVPLGLRSSQRALPDQFADLRSRFLVAPDNSGVLAPQFRWWRVAADAGDTAVNAFVEETLRPWRHIQFDALHIYRLPLAPFARAFEGGTVKRFLDIDDIESITSDRLAELYRLNNRMSSARSSRQYADVHRIRESAAYGALTACSSAAMMMQCCCGKCTNVLCLCFPTPSPFLRLDTRAVTRH